MKAITVLGPWAWAIVRGVKPVENRTWPTHYRGGLWVHCGLSRRSDGAARALLESLGVACPTPAALDALRGKVIGACELVACERLEDRRTRLFAAGDEDPLATGPWCWGLATPQALFEPVACGGRLSLWELPAEVERICAAQLKSA